MKCKKIIMNSTHIQVTQTGCSINDTMHNTMHLCILKGDFHVISNVISISICRYRDEEINFNPSIERAERHLRKTSCTIHDEDTDAYHWRSPWRTTMTDLGNYGVGIQLYFNFLCILMVTFLFMGFMTLPLLSANAAGHLVSEEEPYLAQWSIANLGYCGEFGDLCDTRPKKRERCMKDPGTNPETFELNPCPMDEQLRDKTPLFGNMDAAAIVLMVVVAVAFEKYWLNHVVEQNDDDYITPADFGVVVYGVRVKIHRNVVYGVRILELLFTAQSKYHIT
jgi:hypothetical protein